MTKQVGRPEQIDHEEDELFVVVNPAPAVLNDPGLARTNKGLPFDKMPERFPFEPEKDD